MGFDRRLPQPPHRILAFVSIQLNDELKKRQLLLNTIQRLLAVADIQLSSAILEHDPIEFILDPPLLWACDR